MRGISLITALEIVTNPRDIGVVIGTKIDGGPFAFEFRRGSGHNYKLLISTEPVFVTQQDAADEVRNVLESIRLSVLSELIRRKSPLVQLFGTVGVNVDERVLSTQVIDWIIEQLKEHGSVYTETMP